MRLHRLTLVAALAGGVISAHAACPSDLETALVAARYANLQPAPNPSQTLSDADAACARDKLLRYLGQQGLGRVVGYKAGLTNAAVQKRFNASAPVRGTLLAGMLVRDGAELPAKFGSRPLFEADLVVEVRDAGIMKAKTPLDVLAHVAAFHPFIELPDLIVEDPARINGPVLTALNVGARLGVLGTPFTLPVTSASVDALAAMKVRLLDQDGQELDAGSGAAILGQPLKAVLWLVEDLAASGITLKKGDLLSLGSFSKLLPPKAGTAVKLVYEGLPGNPSASVRFR